MEESFITEGTRDELRNIIGANMQVGSQTGLYRTHVIRNGSPQSKG